MRDGADLSVTRVHHDKKPKKSPSATQRETKIGAAGNDVRAESFESTSNQPSGVGWRSDVGFSRINPLEPFLL